MTDGGEDAATCSCKVGRSSDRYGLADLDPSLVRRRETEGESLRDLADHVNRRILEAALDDAGVDVTDALYGAVGGDGALGTLYEALVGEDTPAERTARVRTRLSQLGVDVEAVDGDWVTHTTVRTHLRECLNVDTQRTATITPDEARDTFEWARTQCENIVDQTFTRLQNADVLATGSLDVTVTIRLTCSDCGETYRPRQLLERRACDCESTGDAAE